MIEILNISQIVWFKDMIDFSIGSNSKFRELILVPTEDKVRYVSTSWSFKHCLNSRIVYFFSFKSSEIIIVDQNDILVGIRTLLLIQKFLSLTSSVTISSIIGSKSSSLTIFWLIYNGMYLIERWIKLG